MRLGIAIDEWKLPIFERHLTAAGCTFQKQRLTATTLLLTVHAASPEAKTKDA